MNPTIRRKARLRRASSRLRVEALETRQLLSTFQVTNAADSGAGSFRQAILDNDATPGLNTIDFAIPGSGVHTISLSTPLPAINNPAIVDATTQPGYAGTPLVELNGANIFSPGVTPPTPQYGVAGLTLSAGSSTVMGLTIDRFTGNGIVATGDGNTIAADFIGTDPTGTRSSGNGFDGIFISSRNNTIGGIAAADRDVISANGEAGILLTSSGGQPSNSVIEGDLIGTDVTGTLDLGNGQAGVFVESSGNTIGGLSATSGNTIAFNGGAGVQVGNYTFESGVTRNRIVGNSIFGNFGLGIDLGNDGVTPNTPGGANSGPNNRQNYPVLTSAYSAAGGGTTVEGTLNASPNSNYTVSFYSSPQADPSGFGQGQTPIGSETVTTDAIGNVDITTMLTAPVPPGQVISATATDSAGNTSEFARSVTVRATAQADLALTAFPQNPTAQANVAQTYTYTVTNNGPSKATNVVFTDVLPQGASFLSGTTSQGTLLQSNGTVTASLTTLTSGSAAEITLTYSLPTAGPALNQASVKADQPDPSPANNTITQNFQVAAAPPTDLVISGAATPDPVQVGNNLTYTFLITNVTYFNTATGVTFSDTLPQGLTFVSAQSSQGPVTEANGVVTGNLGTISGGANATVTVTATPTAPGPLLNTATVKGDEPDLNALNNAVTVISTVTPAPMIDLAVAVTSAPQTPQVGQEFTYVVLVANVGGATATNVTLANVLPDAASIVSIKPSQGTYTLTGNAVSANLGSLSPGALTALTVVLRAGAPGLIVDQAAVSADQPDFDVYNNYDARTTMVTADQSGPFLLNQRLTVSHMSITGVVLTFNKALDPTLASDLSNYAIEDLGHNSSISASGPAVPLSSVTYDPITRSVTLTPEGGLAVGRFYKLILNGPGAPGITDTSGNVLDGTRNGLQNSIYTALIGRGTVTRPTAIQVSAKTPYPTKVKGSSTSSNQTSTTSGQTSTTTSQTSTTSTQTSTTHVKAASVKAAHPAPPKAKHHG